MVAMKTEKSHIFSYHINYCQEKKMLHQNHESCTSVLTTKKNELTGEQLGEEKYQNLKINILRN